MGIVAFSIGIWVVVDKPAFLDVLNSASDACTVIPELISIQNNTVTTRAMTATA